MADLFILMPVSEDQMPLFAWRSAGDWIVDSDIPAGKSLGEGAVAFVPGTAVTAGRAEIAARKPVEARRIALFALEDDLAQPVEMLHAALGPSDVGQPRPVHVVAAADMRRWMDRLSQYGLPDADLVATHACVPDAVLACEGPHEILFRTSATSFALDADAPEDLIQTLAPAGDGVILGDRTARILGKTPVSERVAEDAAWLIKLASWYSDASPSNMVSLRQGDFSVRRPLQIEGLSKWKAVGALAACVAVGWLGSIWLETQALDKQTRALEAQTRDLIAAVAPEAGGRLQPALATLRSGSGQGGYASLRPTTATAALYEAIAPVEDAEVRSIRYDAANGRLVAMLVFASYAQADAIGDRLEEKGLSVRLGEARQSGDRVAGEFTIEASS